MKRYQSCPMLLLVLLFSACASSSSSSASPTLLPQETNRAVANPTDTQPAIAQSTAIAMPTCLSSTATGCVQTTPEEIVGHFEWSHGTCHGKGPGRLRASPMNPGDIALIQPMGLMVGGHVTPIDHQYYLPTNFRSPPDTYPV